MSKYILKLARCIQELERIKGVRVGGNRGNQYTKAMDSLSFAKTPQITQEDIAKQFGIGSFDKVRTTKCPSKTPQITQVDTTKCPLYKITNKKKRSERLLFFIRFLKF